MGDVPGMIHLRRAWRYATEPEVVHFTIVKDGHNLHTKLERSSNPALYDFLVKRAVIANDPRPTPEPSAPESN